MIDFSKIRVGDEVTISAKVTEVHDNWIKATNGSLAHWSVGRGKIATHTPAPREVEVGDKVTFIDSIYKWEVTALSGQRAWVTFGECDRVIPVSCLKHAD